MKRVIVGITGATGQIYGIRLLEALREAPSVESHLIISPWAEKTLCVETGYSKDQVKGLATQTYEYCDLSAAVSSGSFRCHGMVICPCTIKTLSAIANSYNENLIVRAADVSLKERRPLILVVRETPLHLGHLRLMIQACEAGGIILPPVPAFYNHPRTIDDLINHTVGRILDLLDIDQQLSPRWEGA